MKRLFLAVVLCLAACGTQPNTSSKPHAADVITAEELASTALTVSNLYEAVYKLRPVFFNRRGGQPVMVYLDELPFGGVESLRLIQLGGIYEVRRLVASDATTRFGPRTLGPVIWVRTLQ